MFKKATGLGRQLSGAKVLAVQAWEAESKFPHPYEKTKHTMHACNPCARGQGRADPELAI